MYGLPMLNNTVYLLCNENEKSRFLFNQSTLTQLIRYFSVSPRIILLQFNYPDGMTDGWS